ncbi:isochorismate synthase [Brachybacterium hainanense]|uniref:Isochorismate synthase MenF n=1 Tax=Brachybacterium hainanense TaxID=1541174 RepID=A0ABV6RFN3_9MICO
MSTIELTSVPGAREVALSVRTVRLDDPVDLVQRIPTAASAVWLHHGQGMVALGEAVRVRTAGPDRFTRANAILRELAEHAVVEDEVLVRGSGLLAFGSFSYGDSSPRPSQLLIPRLVLGSVDGDAFLTRIRIGAPAEDPSAPEEEMPDWRGLFATVPLAPPVPFELDPDHAPEEYQRLVARAVAHVRAGDARKIVLSESSTARTRTPVDTASLLRRLAARYPSTWVYRVSDVIGASPEMLAQTENGRVFSRVLAGSRPVAEGEELPEQDRQAFRTDAKEVEEHRFAIDSVTERLAGLAGELTASPEPFVLRLPGIEHLASDVSARLHPGVTSLDVAARLHPSAAVSGTPREAADALIGQLEPRDRGGYASPVGWMTADGDGQWAIALRMAHLVDPCTVRVQAGGGLVAASDPVTEHAEVLAKYRPMLSALRGV